MSNDGDLLDKADALLKKHVADTNTATVPILTDLLDAPVDVGSPAANELAREVFTRVIAEVEGRLRTDLQERMIQHLVPQVQAAVASALGDLHQELANAIGDAVTAALKARQVK